MRSSPLSMPSLALILAGFISIPAGCLRAEDAPPPKPSLPSLPAGSPTPGSNPAAALVAPAASDHPALDALVGQGPGGTAPVVATEKSKEPAATSDKPGTTAGTKDAATPSAPTPISVAKLVSDFAAKHGMKIAYLPGGAQLANDQELTLGKTDDETQKIQDSLDIKQVEGILASAGLVLIEGTEITNALKSHIWLKPKSAARSYVIGSLDGELTVLRRPSGRAGDARHLLAYAEDSGGKAFEEKLFPQGGKFRSAAELEPLLVSHLDEKSTFDHSLMGNLGANVGALDDKIAQNCKALLVSLFGPGTAVPGDCDGVGLTLAAHSPYARLILSALLNGVGDEMQQRAAFGFELVPVDQNGRFIVTYPLRHAWVNDFQYQRAFAADSSEPSLHVAGILGMVNDAVQDFAGNAKLVEDTSAAAPVVPSIGVHLPVFGLDYVINNKELVTPQAFVRRLLGDAAGDPKQKNTLAAVKFLLVLAATESKQMITAQKADWETIAADSGMSLSRPAVFGALVKLQKGTTAPSYKAHKRSAKAAGAKGTADPAISASPQKPTTISTQTPASPASSAKLVSSTDGTVGGAAAQSLTDAAKTATAAVDTAKAAADTAKSAADTAKAAADTAKSASDAAKSAASGKTPDATAAATADTASPPGADSILPHLQGKVVLADVSNNALLVVVPKFEAAVTVRFLAFMEKLISDLDAERQMVEISVSIIDTDASTAEEWGSRFAVAGNGHLGKRPAFGVSGFNVPVPAAGAAQGAFSSILNPTSGPVQLPSSTVESTALSQGLNVGSLLVGSSVQFLNTLHALETEGNGKVIARPSVLTTDNSEAILTEETKIYSPASGRDVGTLAEVPVGIKVAVTPQIVTLGDKGHEHTAVRMRINVKEGTGSDNKNQITLPAGVISVDNSQFKTIAVVEQGQSLMVAGRLRHDESSTDSHVPVLGRIPLLGRAFKNSNLTKSRQQRIVLITPTIVDPGNYHSKAADEAASAFSDASLSKGRSISAK